MRSLDGQVVRQGSVEWVLHDEQDDDGRWHFWSTCETCGGVERGDEGRGSHVCPTCRRCKKVVEADGPPVCDDCYYEERLEARVSL